MNVKQALGARIRELRHKLGMTQETFAESVGVAPRHISRIENGVNTPSIESLEHIAKVLNVEIKELYNFQHLLEEKYLRVDIEKIISSLNSKELVQAYKILNALFR